MLTAHQRIQISHAGLRVEDDIGSMFVAILDHPTMARAEGFGWCGGTEARDDLPPITLPFVAFRARRSVWMDIVGAGTAAQRGVVRSVEWSVDVLHTEPDEDGMYYVPQLDVRGQNALAFLDEFVAGLD